MDKKILENLKEKYCIRMPLSGIVTSTFEKLSDGFLKNMLNKSESTFAYLGYDVKKGSRWEMRFYRDKDKEHPVLEVFENKKAWLSSSGYEIKDLETGKVLGAWVPKKRLLKFFLRQRYDLVVDGQVVMQSPGDSAFMLFLSIFLPHARRLFARRVMSQDKTRVAKIRCISTCGNGAVYVTPQNKNKRIEDDETALFVSVLAAISGLED